MKKKLVLIGIEKCPNPDRITFHLKDETKKHLELGKRLMDLSGILDDHAGEGLPLCMEHSKNYDFGLSKGKMFKWEKELLPNIKREIKSYFREKGNTVRFVKVEESETKIS